MSQLAWHEHGTISGIPCILYRKWFWYKRYLPKCLNRQEWEQVWVNCWDQVMPLNICTAPHTPVGWVSVGWHENYCHWVLGKAILGLLNIGMDSVLSYTDYIMANLSLWSPIPDRWAACTSSISLMQPSSIHTCQALLYISLCWAQTMLRWTRPLKALPSGLALQSTGKRNKTQGTK